jgi:DNA-binding transcriptional MocR family regulator
MSPTEPWDLEALDALFRQTGATIDYLMPDFQNPTGRLMSDPRREELVWVCRRRGVTLIVDETLAEIVLESRRKLGLSRLSAMLMQSSQSAH